MIAFCTVILHVSGQALGWFSDFADFTVNAVPFKGSVRIRLSLEQPEAAAVSSYGTVLSENADNTDTAFSEAWDGTGRAYFLYPGCPVPFAPEAECLGIDCYVRLRARTESESDALRSIDILSLADYDTERFIRCGDCLYLKEALSRTDGAVRFFNGFSFPQEFGSEEALMSFSAVAILEAIQAAGVEPDYTSSAPWGDAEILACAERTIVQEPEE